MVLTAVKRQEPQQTCPQGVSVALLGGKKQIGQVYSDSGSAGDLEWDGVGGRIGEKDMAVALLLPLSLFFPLSCSLPCPLLLPLFLGGRGTGELGTFEISSWGELCGGVSS